MRPSCIPGASHLPYSRDARCARRSWSCPANEDQEHGRPTTSTGLPNRVPTGPVKPLSRLPSANHRRPLPGLPGKELSCGIPIDTSGRSRRGAGAIGVGTGARSPGSRHPRGADRAFAADRRETGSPRDDGRFGRRLGRIAHDGRNGSNESPSRAIIPFAA